MNCQRTILLLSAFALGGLWLAGCGAHTDAPETTKVIRPATTETETANKPADDSSNLATTASETTATASDSPAAADAEPIEEPEQTAETVVTSTTPKTADDPQPPAAEPPASDSTTFKGRIVVKGTVPSPPPIMPKPNDAFCLSLGTIPREEAVIGEDGGLANVFVWLRKVPDGVEVPAPPEEPAVLDQKNCRFAPRALVAQVGQKLLLKNDDPTAHNTRINGLRVSFNSIVSPNNRGGIEVPFQRPEIVPIPVDCDVHDWMSCRILFVDNPWHAITDENGNFEINDLPAGELEFRLQHEKAGYVERSLDLTFEDGQTIEKSFEVDAAKLTD